MFISLKMPHENASLYHLYFMIIIYFVLPTKSLYLFSPIHYNNDTEFDSNTTKKNSLTRMKRSIYHKIIFFLIITLYDVIKNLKLSIITTRRLFKTIFNGRCFFRSRFNEQKIYLYTSNWEDVQIYVDVGLSEHSRFVLNCEILQFVSQELCN